eukprot:3372818-Pyramimonas_sp.AAC.1
MQGRSLANVWLIHVRAPSNKATVCAHEAKPPPAGSQCVHIVSDSRSTGAQRCKVLTRAGSRGCSEE